jgi:cytochrome P450 family 3 subfamily A
VKHFDCFQNRKSMGLTPERPMNKMLTVLQDDEWKNVRHLCSPAFSGSKLRSMSAQLNRCAHLLINNIAEEEGGDLDVIKHMGAFSMDVIASVAFGLDIDSQRDPDDPFIHHARKSFKPNMKNPLMLLMLFVPSIAPLFQRLFGLRILPEDTCEFFMSILNQVMEARRKEGKDRTDFLQLMLNAHDGGKSLGHDEVLSQGFIFFFAGYSTISGCITNTLHLLALHPDIQEKLCDEINEQLADLDPDYDSVQRLPYLDRVLNESLRIYSPALRVNRTCSQNVTIQGVHFTKGMVVLIPIQAIQMDPELWSDPEKFDPDRFSADQKEGRHPMAWQPFGVGPRHCLGMRLALMETKVALIHLVRKFRFHVCDKTNIPLKRDKMGGQPKEVFLKVTSRSSAKKL